MNANVREFLAEMARVSERYKLYLYADGGMQVMTWDTGRTVSKPVEMRECAYKIVKETK